jgi:hypothetical protein
MPLNFAWRCRTLKYWRSYNEYLAYDLWLLVRYGLFHLSLPLSTSQPHVAPRYSKKGGREYRKELQIQSKASGCARPIEENKLYKNSWDLSAFQEEECDSQNDQRISRNSGRPNMGKYAVLEYNNSESKIGNKIHWNPEWVFEQQGTSNFWGHIFVNLDSGKLVKGDLYEYVVVKMNTTGLKEPLHLFERRYIEINKITKGEFDGF